MIPPAVPTECRESLLFDDVRARGSTVGHTVYTPLVHTDYIVSDYIVCICARVRMYHKRGGRAGAHALTGALQAGQGALSREPVRQLLTGLSHPAREKDHLARRADISNDTAARLFGLPLSSLSLSLFFSFSFSSLPFPRGPIGPSVLRSFPSVVALDESVQDTRTLSVFSLRDPGNAFR